MSDLICTCMKGNQNRASFYVLVGFFFHFDRTIYYISILNGMIPYKNVSLLYIVYKTRTLAVRSTTYCGRIITVNMYIACKMLEESTSLFTCYLFNSFRA